MKPAYFYRAAAVLLLIFTAGHTVGFLTFTPPTAQGVAVRDAMDHVVFFVKGTPHTYGGLYRGFGLFVSASLLFQAWIAWVLGSMAKREAAGIVALSVPFILFHLGDMVLSWMYFSWPPLVFSGLVVLCLSAGAMLARRSAQV